MRRSFRGVGVHRHRLGGRRGVRHRVPQRPGAAGGRVLLHRGPFGGRALLRAGRHRPGREGARGGAQGVSGRRHGRDRGGGVRHAQGHGPRRSQLLRPSVAGVLARGHHGHERQDHHDVSGGAHRARLRQAHRRHRHGGDAHRRRAGEDRAHHARIARPAAPVRAHARRALRRGGHGGGQLARARPSAHVEHHVRRHGVHQPHAGPPGLPPHLRRVLRGQGVAVLARLSCSPRRLHRRQVGPRLCGAAPRTATTW